MFNMIVTITSFAPVFAFRTPAMPRVQATRKHRGGKRHQRMNDRRQVQRETDPHGRERNQR